MIEIPEATALSLQIAARLQGRTIAAVTAAATEHKLAWYYGSPASYGELAAGRS